MRIRVSALVVSSLLVGLGSLQAKDEDKTGAVSLGSVPGATVYIEGKRVGETPLAKLELPIGKHELRLVNEAAELEKTITVDVHPNKTARYMTKLWNDTLRCEPNDDKDQKGQMRFESNPPAEVYVNGRRLGMTPAFQAVGAESPGVVEVHLLDPKSKRSKTFPVTTGDGFVCRAQF